VQPFVQDIINVSSNVSKAGNTARSGESEGSSFKEFLSSEFKGELKGLREFLKLSPEQARERLQELEPEELVRIKDELEKFLKKWGLLEGGFVPLADELLIALLDLKGLLDELLAEENSGLSTVKTGEQTISAKDPPAGLKEGLQSEPSNQSKTFLSEDGKLSGETSGKQINSTVEGVQEGPDHMAASNSSESDTGTQKGIFTESAQERGSPGNISSPEGESAVRGAEEKNAYNIEEARFVDSIPDNLKNTGNSGRGKNAFYRPGLAPEIAEAVSANGQIVDSESEKPGLTPGTDRQSVLSELAELKLKNTVLSGIEKDAPSAEGQSEQKEGLDRLMKLITPLDQLQQGWHQTGTRSSSSTAFYRSDMQGMIEQLNQVIRLYNSGQKEIRFQLEPEELGKVRLNLRVIEGEVAARLTVESQFVRDYLEQNLSNLKNNLSRQGLDLQQFEIVVKDSFEQEFQEGNQQGSQYFEQQQQQQNGKQQDAPYNDFDLDYRAEDLQSPGEVVRIAEPGQSRRNWVLLNYTNRQMNLLA